MIPDVKKRLTNAYKDLQEKVASRRNLMDRNSQVCY